jgi:hypothetical protein
VRERAAAGTRLRTVASGYPVPLSATRVKKATVPKKIPAAQFRHKKHSKAALVLECLVGYLELGCVTGRRGVGGWGRRPVAPIEIVIPRRPVQPQCGALPFGERHGVLSAPARSSRAAAANAYMFAMRSGLPVAKVTARSAGPAIARQVCPAGSP